MPRQKNNYCRICNKLIWDCSTHCILHGLLKSAKKRMKNRRNYKGKNNPNYKKGQKQEHGYIYIYKSNHPNAKRNYVKRAILIMEKHLGRYLKKNEIVHHKDRNRLNDKLSNFKLCKNQAEHKTIDVPLKNKKTGRFIKTKRK